VRKEKTKYIPLSISQSGLYFPLDEEDEVFLYYIAEGKKLRLKGKEKGQKLY